MRLTLPPRRRHARSRTRCAAARRVRARRAGHAVQPHRLLGRARGGRCARRRSTRGSTARSTGTRPSPTASACGRMGLGVAEAMDTAQRGMGLDWPTSLELIRRSLDAARDMPGALIACGCGTDHLAPEAAKQRRRRDPRLRRADGGDREARRPADRDGQPRAGARGARARPTTSASTTACCARRAQPVILHWLGDMFDPALHGLLGQRRRRRGDGHGARHHRGACGQGRRHQDLAARQGQGDRDAPPPAGRACACTPATTSTTPS